VFLWVGLLCTQGLSDDKPAASPVFTNSLGQPFVKVGGTDTLFCIWETRVQDYQQFVGETKRKWDKSGFTTSSRHPAAKVSWEDATMFCHWLTQREQKSGILPEGWKYRLPKSAEWSLAVGIKPEDSQTVSFQTPAELKAFPWNGEWPPPMNSGNYHPELAIDAYKNTSPVATFPANRYGIYDMGGNLWEWCSDPWKNSIDYRVLRGASWRMRSAGDLLSALEIGNISHTKLSTYGFRVVIERPAETQAPIAKTPQVSETQVDPLPVKLREALERSANGGR
ncbi:MAG: SUMF1/EgtB/PvdO family nonheme iron enzyme, partial [Verrucomicrobiota bacterium]